MMAAAGKVTIAEVEAMVAVGGFEPESVHTPSIYVQRIICCDKHEKRIERRTVQKGDA